MLYDLIKSHAALFFRQRRQEVIIDGTLCVYADKADFTAANEVFTLLNGTAGGQETKLTRREASLLDAIREADQIEYTIQEIQRLTGWPYSTIYRSLKGYDSRGKNYTGLLEKCPAISFTDRTITSTGEDGNTVRRRTEAYVWDRELYRQWNGGGACWLDPGPDDGDDNDTGLFPAFQQVSSIFPANAGNENGASGAPGSCNGEQIDKNFVQGSGCFQKSGNYGAVCEPDAGTEQSLYFAGNAANNDPDSQKSTGSANEKYPAPGLVPAKTGNVLESAEKKHPLRSIRAKDYKKLDIPEPKTPCFVCGKKGSWFVEKFTKDRRARKKEEQDARRLCRSCHAAAVKAEQEASVSLPGTFDLSKMKRVTADLGKCPVCGVAKVEWIEEESGVMLCGRCYEREKANLRDAGKMR